MREGWVKLHRVLLDSDVFEAGNEKLLRTWLWILLKASHKELVCTVGLQTVNLKPGQFVTGRKKAAAELSCSESTVYRQLKALEKMGRISVDANNKFSVVTVENWGKYQSLNDKSEQQTDSKRTADEHKQEEKKEKKFLPPTVGEVTDYCKERRNAVDPEQFVDFYQAKGWMVGKNKMSDWKAAVRTWERNNKDHTEKEQIEIDYGQFGI